jgi:hypothetical protein
MAVSYATAGLRGSVSRQRATDKQRAHKARSSLGLKVGSSSRWDLGAHLVLQNATGRARRGSRLEQLRLLGGAVRGFTAVSSRSSSCFAATVAPTNGFSFRASLSLAHAALASRVGGDLLSPSDFHLLHFSLLSLLL